MALERNGDEQGRCNLTHDELATRLDAIFANCFNSGPVSDASIDDAERELGLRFPASYRTYLRRYGASFGSGFEIHGLPPKPADDIPPQWSDVVASTMRLRPSSLPQDSVEISHDGMDHGYFLQCSPTDARYEGPVIEWGPDHDGGKEVCSDFLEFVTTRCCT